jgi:hypothetical protein
MEAKTVSKKLSPLAHASASATPRADPGNARQLVARPWRRGQPAPCGTGSVFGTGPCIIEALKKLFAETKQVSELWSWLAEVD